MIKEIFLSIFRLAIVVVVVVLTTLMLVEIGKEKEVIVDTIESPSVSLFDSNNNEVTKINYVNLIPNEQFVYYLVLNNYNDLSYRIVFDIFTNAELIFDLEIKVNDEVVIFNNYRGTTNWIESSDDEITYEINFFFSSTNNNLQNKEMNFDIKVEKFI